MGSKCYVNSVCQSATIEHGVIKAQQSEKAGMEATFGLSYTLLQQKSCTPVIAAAIKFLCKAKQCVANPYCHNKVKVKVKVNVDLYSSLS